MASSVATSRSECAAFLIRSGLAAQKDLAERVKATAEKIRELKERYHLTVLMAEQNFNQATRIADRGYIIVHGRIEFEGRSTRELAEGAAHMGQEEAGLLRDLHGGLRTREDGREHLLPLSAREEVGEAVEDLRGQ